MAENKIRPGFSNSPIRNNYAIKACLAFISLLFAGCLLAQNNARPYTLTGKIAGKASGYVYLTYNSETTGVTDTVLINNGKFIFKGNITQPFSATLTLIPPFEAHSDEAVFYIEPGVMQFYADSANLHAFTLKGSPTDSERAQLAKIKAPVEEQEAMNMNKARQVYNKYQQAKKDGADSLQLFALSTALDSLQDIIHTFQQKANRFDSAFIVHHPASYLAADLLWDAVSLQRTKFASLSDLYNRFPENIKQSVSGKKIAYAIKKDKNIYVGANAPDFAVRNFNGDTIHLKYYEGKKYVLLDFWASWCIPCRALTPSLKDVYDKHKNTLEIISISDESTVNEWLAAIKKDNMSWQQVLVNDSSKALMPLNKTIDELYYVRYIPTLILIDKNLKIAGLFNGRTTAKELNEAIDKVAADAD